MKPLSHAVSIAVAPEDSGAQVLLVLRPDDDPELPGVWGLPAASVRPGESLHQAVRRVAVEKLGVSLRLGPLIGSGQQEREDYTLTMSLFRGTLSGAPPALPVSPEGGSGATMYAAWRWGHPEELLAAARRGSLCSLLLLESLGLSPGL